jgi:hypothetical protein
MDAIVRAHVVAQKCLEAEVTAAVGRGRGVVIEASPAVVRAGGAGGGAVVAGGDVIIEARAYSAASPSQRYFPAE